MQINKNSLKQFNLAIAFFLAFAGFYVVIMAMANMGMRDMTRVMTIPIRVLIVTCFCLAFLLRPKLKLYNGLLFFLLFAVLYYSRIAIEFLDISSNFHIQETEFLLYFTSFVFLPLIFISQMGFSKLSYSTLFYSIITGCILVSIGSFIFYQDFLGQVTRLASSIDNFVISPLHLSYTSSLGIGVGVSYLLTNEVKGLKKVFIYLTLLSCLVPFFLGASRGSILALTMPFVFYIYFIKGLKSKLLALCSLLILTILLIVASEYFGQGIFERFFSIVEAIEMGDSSANRLKMWEAGMVQFSENPIFGSSLELESINFHPHNILVETLITTGLIGFIFYSSFIFFVFKKSVLILKQRPAYFFIVVIFLQAFIKNMFSGGIYSTSWLAISAGLILGFFGRDK